MTDFNEEYFIILENDKPCYPTLAAKGSTSDRPYGRRELSRGGPPLMFIDGFRDEHLRDGVREVLTDVLFDGANMVVTSKIKNGLEQFDIDGLQYYPAIYIDNAGTWHEDYWYLNFYKRIDCWDRKLSAYDSDFDESDPHNFADVDKYSLDADKLAKIPEKKRIMFKMGRSTGQYIFAHKKVAKFLLLEQIPSMKLFKVSEFEEGDQL